MKLKRYYSSHSTVAELKSVRDAQITPTEAANLQMAKYGAIAAGAEAIGDVTAGIAEIKASTELNNAISDLDDAMNKLDRDIEEMPVELDEQGNVKFDADKIIEMERGARESLITAIRENIGSGSAQAAFDKHTVQVNRLRGGQTQVAQIGREKKTLEANAELRRANLLRDGRHNDALKQAEMDVKLGTISTDAYNDARRGIKLDRDVDTVTRVALNPEAKDYEIEMMIDSLKNGVWSDALGFDDPTMEMDDLQRTQWQGKMFSHGASIDSRAADERKLMQQQNTLTTLQGIVGGTVGVNEVVNLPLELVGMEGIKYLMAQSRAVESGTKSSPAAMTEKYDMILDMLVEGAEEGHAESIKVLIRNDDRIFGDDQLTLFTAVDNAVAGVSRWQPQRAILDAELVKLQGLTSLDTWAGTTTDRRSERSAGEEMKKEFWKAARSMGSEFTEEFATNWINDNKVTYYRTALTDTLAEKGIPMSGVPDNREDAQAYIRGRLVIYLEDDLTFAGRNRWIEMSEDEQSVLLQEEMVDVELLMRHVWGDE